MTITRAERAKSVRTIGSRATLCHVQGSSILLIIGVHLHGSLIIPLCLVSPATAGTDHTLEVIPLGIVIGNGVQQLFGKVEIALLDGHADTGIRAAVAAAVSAAVTATITAVGISCITRSSRGCRIIY